MNKLPAWAKVIAVIVIFAVLYGGSQLLLWLDHGTAGKPGMY